MDACTSQRIVSFKYNTLSDAAGYIRLLEVLDDDYSENIKVRCRISTWLVDNAPSYYAISYTWGDPEPESTILVNGQVFRVRANCEFVLKQAYWYNKTYYYWIDAICINQENLEGKSMQVSIMGSIYRKAARVLACVGDHGDDSTFLVHKLKQRAFTKGPNPRYSGMRLSLRF
ncbi:heterokaryon incompatibility protein-domain-containing protein [Diaporthe sp. PMI_573]|nr:heterokaryon incompatibility protein-domain-containing protein [Diaporthaceae sp. PMI_573]